MYEQVSSVPVVAGTFALFIVGLVVQGYRFFKITKKKQKLFPPNAPKRTRPRPKDLRGLYRLFVGTYDDFVGRLRTSVVGTHPLMTLTTLTFHVLLVLTPLFVLGHNEMIRDSIGFALPSFPDELTDFLTVIVLLCLGVFLYRRLFLRRVRAITSVYDYFVLAVTAAPFITGFLAYHQIFGYRTVLTIHIVAGELMLILIPWTRLGHALFFFLYRFFMPSEHSFGRGSRAWQPASR